MNISFPKLYVGPMSKNIVDVVVDNNINVGFCASRRQIEWDSGYVNNWTTESFTKYVKYKPSNILVCRDHGGPGQGVKNDDGLNSFYYDAKFMDIIHIDPWKNFRSLEEGLNKTIKCIKFCDSINNNCLYEVGTEEAIRKITSDELYILLKNLKIRLKDDIFKKIIYVVIQSGTSLCEDKNTGKYDEKRLKKMIDVCKEFSVLSKEHNGDYLSSTIIKEKFDLGLDAINIAPEFGIIETLCIMNRISNDPKILNEIYKLCYNSGKWKKWVSNDFNPEHNKEQTIKISCHYIFSDERFENILKSNLFKGVNSEIKSKIKDRIFEIIK